MRADKLLISQNTASGLYNIADDGGLTLLADFEILAENFSALCPPSAPSNLQRERGFSNKQVLNSKLRTLGCSPAFPTFLNGLEADLPQLVALRL